ncbi:WAT1-related protein At5g07050-like [Nymphaea colorata]|nr:WAT1-related protein At5g07050-like [Nymphaea colorata]
MKQSAIPYLAMVCLQLAYVGSNFLCKAALDEGMSIFVFVVYRHIIAMSILGPFAYYHERERRPRLTISTAMKLSFLALIGITFQQNVHYAGLRYATPTVASALNNLIPAVTFVMAVLFRMEKVCIQNLHGQAKVFGTLVCIGGALIFTFWKGVVFKGFQISMFNIYRATPVSQRHDWFKGSALLTTSYIAFSSYLIFQAAIYKEFPAPLSMTALVCSFSSLQALVVALAFERHSSAWRLSWNLQLITIIYCGTIMSIVVYYVQTWCISKRGPVFVSAFQPLLFMVIGLLSFLLFAEQLPLGSLVGAIIIIIGLYCVLWGKSSDTKVGIDEEMANKEVTESKTSSFCSTDCKPNDPVAVIK